MGRTSRDADDAADRLEALIREANGATRDLRAATRDGTTVLRMAMSETFDEEFKKVLMPMVKKIAEQIGQFKNQTYDQVTEVLADVTKMQIRTSETIYNALGDMLANPRQEARDEFAKALGTELGKSIVLAWRKTAPKAGPARNIPISRHAFGLGSIQIGVGSNPANALTAALGDLTAEAPTAEELIGQVNDAQAGLLNPASVASGKIPPPAARRKTR